MAFGRTRSAAGSASAATSSEGYFSIDWNAAQAAGTLDGAVESAVGVLLYQMGIGSLVPLGFFLAMALKAWRLYASSRNPHARARRVRHDGRAGERHLPGRSAVCAAARSDCCYA